MHKSPLMGGPVHLGGLLIKFIEKVIGLFLVLVFKEGVIPQGKNWQVAQPTVIALIIDNIAEL